MRWLPGMDRAIKEIKNEKIDLASVCKNTAGAIGRLRGDLETTGKRFGDYRVIMYENDSGDGTGEQLKRWAAENPKVNSCVCVGGWVCVYVCGSVCI